MTSPQTVDSLSALQSIKTQLIRKALNFSVFVAPYSAAFPGRTDIFDATTGKLLSGSLSDFTDVGYVTTDGAKIADSLSMASVNSLQSTSPTRMDPTGDDKTIQFVGQETNLTNVGLLLGADTTTLATTPDAGGSVSFDSPKLRSNKKYRVVAIAADTIDSGEIYIVRAFPAGIVTAIGDQSFNQDEVQYDITMQGLYDSDAGTDHRWMAGGAGWLAQLTDAGFTAGS